METLRKLYESEKVRYLVVGGLTTVVNLAVFHVMVDMLHCNVTFSNVVSIIVAIVFAFFANKHIVFRSVSTGAAQLISEFAKFVGGRLISLGIEVGGVYLLHDVMSAKAMVAKLATQVIVIVLNYFFSKFFVFRKTENETPEEP